jgi:hypothetical protein
MGTIDYTALSSAISFANLAVAVMAVGGLVATVYATIKGTKMLVAMVRGA